MGEALSLVIGGLNHEHALAFAATSVLLQVFARYRRYVPAVSHLVLFLYDSNPAGMLVMRPLAPRFSCNTPVETTRERIGQQYVLRSRRSLVCKRTGHRRY